MEAKRTRRVEDEHSQVDRAAMTGTLFTFLTAFVVGLYYCVQVVGGLADLRGPGGATGFDYRDTVWMPLREFLNGEVPWDTTTYLPRHPHAQNFPLYTPHYWWLVLPFVAMPYRLGAGAWTFLAVFALFALVHYSLRSLLPVWASRMPWLGAAMGAMLCFTRPGRAGILSANWATFCAVAAGMLLLPFWTKAQAGMLVVVALVKPQVGLPVVLQQLILRKFRVTLVAVAAAMAMSLPIMAVTVARMGGLAETMDMFKRVSAIGDGPGFGPGEALSTRVDLLGTVGHILGHTPGGWTGPFCLVVAFVTTLGSYLVLYSIDGPYNPLMLIAGGLAALLIMPNQIYAAPALVPGMIALVDRQLDQQMPVGSKTLCGLLLCLTAVPFFVTGPVPALFGLGNRGANILIGLALAGAALVVSIGAANALLTRKRPADSSDRR